MVIDTKLSRALLRHLNVLNTERAFTRRIVVDDKVLVVGEMPITSLRKGKLEQLTSRVFCCARLDAPARPARGRSVTDPPPALAPDSDSVLSSWEDVLRASRTATEREFAIWLDQAVGCKCWIEHVDNGLAIVIDGWGTGTEYPFCLEELRQSAENLLKQFAE